MVLYGLLGAAVLIVLYVISIYNSLVSNRAMTQEGWSGIDVQLRRRADLIPNLVEAVKGYAKHEDGLFREIAALRAKSIAGGSITEQAETSNMLSASLKSLFAVAEAYPELKADANFRDLQAQLGSLENEIQMSRRYYNGAARNLNTLIASFPSNLVARNFGFTEAEYYVIEDAALKQVPKVNFAA